MKDARAEKVRVADDPEQRRFVLTVDGAEAGFLQYKVRPPYLVLAHTEIDPGFRGRGLGGRLARAGVESARDRGLKVDVLCPFVAAWIQAQTAAPG